MKVETLKVKYRGKDFEGDIAIPENLIEAISALSEREVYHYFLYGYLEISKKNLRTKRVKKYAHIELSHLSPEERAELHRLEELSKGRSI